MSDVEFGCGQPTSSEIARALRILADEYDNGPWPLTYRRLGLIFGCDFYELLENKSPALVAQLTRIADCLERLADKGAASMARAKHDMPTP